MDKVCRGSPIGDAHTSGAYADAVPLPDTRQYARGTHVSGCSYKLENGFQTKDNQPVAPRWSPTFSSQEWFKHNDAQLSSSAAVPELTASYWKGRNGRSPATSPERGTGPRESAHPSASSSSAARSSQLKFQDALPAAGARTRSPDAGSPPRSCTGTWALSESWFEQQSARSPPPQDRLRGSPSAENGLTPWQTGRRRETAEFGADRRSLSPTYAASADWIRFGHLSPRSAQRSTMESASQPGEAASPGGQSPCGKRVVGSNRNSSDAMGKRMSLQDDAQDFPKSERKHAFVVAPPERSRRRSPGAANGYHFSAVGNGASTPARSALVRRSPRAMSPHDPPAVQVDSQHRTSYEMAAAMQNDSAAPQYVEDSKYLVGDEVISWSHVSRRAAPSCMNAVPSQLTHMGSGNFPSASSSVSALRDHRNSDAFRESYKMPAHFLEPPTTEAQSPAGAERKAPGSAAGLHCGQSSPRKDSGVVPIYPGEPRLVAYGNHSSVPSTMSKDAAYTHTGLAVTRHGIRSAGAFSPNVKRQPLSMS
eukprot:TRINITY_DN57675_c0_g1_i1.p1 TRINITY_DN57675_c0_g1~~TRINITY_DN57675_c0_g1_i1.p1  ORF type:complete len:536 (-),score=78.99 TRINITY_DN57675_c0_g1_i1:195-1802(-)